jgi:flagellar biosynthesis protein FliR
VIDFSPAVRFALLLVRPGMVILTAPMFGAAFAPTHLRVGLAMLFAFMLLPITEVPVALPAVALVLVIARELAIGFALGLAIRALITGAELGGHLCGYQIGLQYGSMVDPINGVRNNMMAGLYGQLAMLTLFASNGHHALVRAMNASYAMLPIGGGHLSGSLVGSVTDMLGIVFVVGMRLALPVIVVLLVVELALGLISRAAPAINLMVISMPIRMVAGLLVVAALVPLVPPLLARFTTSAINLGALAARAFR